MIGRWHSAEELRGFVVAESESAEALFTWTQGWTDKLSFEVTPVVGDEEAAEGSSVDAGLKPWTN